MRRIASFMLVLVALFAAPMAIAQTPANTGTYTVQPGDTGWDLSRQYYDDAAIWQRIVDQNVQLQEPGRVFEKDGRIILLLKPGEQLVGLERLNVAPPTAVSITELVAPVPVVEATAGQLNVWPWYVWLLLLVIVTLAGFRAWRLFRQARAHDERERELRQDPIASGPAMVPGGIPATDAPRLTNFFDQQAINRYASRNPTIDRTTIRATRVSPIEEGTITGEGMVEYLGGEMRPRRIETPLRAYQARYRFPDGTEEVLQCLQACMNPVAYGGETYRGFTFTLTQAIVPVPEPERPAPQPAPHPAIAVRRIRESAQAEGQNTITLGDEVMVFPLGYHLTVDRETNHIRLEASAVQMTLTPKPQAKAEAATGTSDN